MMSGASEVYNHQMIENFREFCPEDGDISYEEFLVQQESVYQSIQANAKNKNPASDHGPTSNYSPSSAWEAEPSHGATFESDWDIEEALARSLQDLDTGAPTHQATPPRVTPQNIRQDDIDPDNMTYEELQNLGDAVGHESKGLPDEVISRLPTFKYKTGLFSKKKIKDECVICCSGYKNGAQLITLPCAHLYHSECITRWLKEQKNCPVCQVNVQVTDREWLTRKQEWLVSSCLYILVMA